VSQLQPHGDPALSHYSRYRPYASTTVLPRIVWALSEFCGVPVRVWWATSGLFSAVSVCSGARKMAGNVTTTTRTGSEPRGRSGCRSAAPFEDVAVQSSFVFESTACFSLLKGSRFLRRATLDVPSTCSQLVPSRQELLLMVSAGPATDTLPPRNWLTAGSLMSYS
jgi:hypothetical protein